jgi:uncharacterized damage-inducible protein DinB
VEETERAGYLRTLNETPERLKAALKGLPKKALLARPAPGKWSILEIVAHMRDMELEAYKGRYERILAEDNPALPDIEGSALAIERDYRSLSLSGVLREWSKARKENLRLLKKMKVAQWERTGVHSTAGPLSMTALLRRHAVGNDEAHLGQIEGIKTRQAALARLAAAPDVLTKAVAGLEPAAAAARPADGKWSIVENACHMRDIELVFVERFTKMAFSERPAFFMLDNDRTAELRRYAESDVRAVAKAFKELRLDTLRLLSSLPAAAWKRTGLHPKRGEMTIEQLAEHLANHDDKHLARIRELAGG